MGGGRGVGAALVADGHVDASQRFRGRREGQGCGDRLAEYVSSRRHLTLEWVIILLLAAEVVLITIDLLAARTP